VGLRVGMDAVEKTSHVVVGKRVMVPNLYTIKRRRDTEGKINKNYISEHRVTEVGTRS
jgi:hypothetical protein